MPQIKSNIYRRVLGLIILSIFCLPYSTYAKKSAKPTPKEPTISVEQEQQFTYYWYAAKQAIVEERYGDAYVLLKFCNAINPEDGTTLCFLGILEQGIGNSLKGLILMRDAFEADPYDQWYQYSKELMDMHSPSATAEALRVVEKAYLVQKKANSEKKNARVDENLLVTLRRLYISAGQFKKALELQDQIEKQQGYTEENVYYRFHLYSALGQDKKAIQAVDKYLEQNPENMEYLPLTILNNYAYYMATHRGDLTKAEKMSAITIREEPNNPVFLDTYGWILHLKGQDELAKFYLEKAKWNSTEETHKDIIKHLNAIQ